MTLATSDTGADRPPTAGHGNLNLTGVRRRRVLAFFIDAAMYVLVAFALSVLTTIGMEDIVEAFVLDGASIHSLPDSAALSYYWMANYAAAVLALAVALSYVALTLGGKHAATWGMQLMSLRLRRRDGLPIGPGFAIAHTVLFWLLSVVFTSLILLASLFLRDKRTVHDLLLNAVVTRAS